MQSDEEIAPQEVKRVNTMYSSDSDSLSSVDSTGAEGTVNL